MIKAHDCLLGYVPLLDSTPVSNESHPEIFARGSEILFGPDHVIEVDSPPRDYIVENYGEEFVLN